MVEKLLSLEGQIAVVTGGARGIGLAIAELLLEHEATTCIFDVDVEQGHRVEAALQRSYGERVKFLSVDVAIQKQVRNAVSTLYQKYRRVDILVNNAGISRPCPIDSLPLEEWNKVIGVNLTGVYNCCRAIFPIMKERKYGRIVNISSVVAKKGTLFGGNSSYTASKAALLGFTKELAIEGAKFNVTVNAIAPGIVDTDLLKALDPEKRASLAHYVPLGRLAQPREIAMGVLFLVSKMANYITGEVLDINGGLLMD